MRKPHDDDDDDGRAMPTGPQHFDPTVPRRGGRRVPPQPPPDTDDVQPTAPGTRGATPPRPTRPTPSERSATAARSDRFQLGSELGRGGMGTVRVAQDPKLGRELAIKFLQAADADAAAQFVEEAQITSQLQHPNIVPIYELGEDAAGRPWLAMKKIEGQSLADQIADAKAQGKHQPLGPDDTNRILDIFGKVCDAVAYAHSCGVIHRDIKPHNIMVGSFGEVLLVDWGLARPLGRDNIARPVRTARRADQAQLTLDGEVFGTPAYMPPEQAEGQIDRVDERSDIFSLGAVLYQLLTLEAPYRGRNAADTVAQAARHQLTPPRRRAPSRRIGKELQAIVLKAMAADPDDRYASVRDFQADLAAWRAHRRTTAWRAGLLSRASKWTRRHPTASLAAALLMVAGLTVAVLVSQLLASQHETELATEVAALRAAQARHESQLREHAEHQRDQLGTNLRAALDKRSLQNLDDFWARLDEAHARGIGEWDFGNTLSKQQVGDYLLAFNALFDVHRVLGTEPDANEHASRGLILGMTGDAKGAIADFDAALQQDPTLVACRIQRGNAYVLAGQTDKAMADYNEALQRDPDAYQAYYNRAILFTNAGRFTEAIDDYDNAIRVYPTYAPAWTNRGALRFRLGQSDAAMVELDHAIRLDPMSKNALCNRGIVLEALGRTEAALADFDAALRIDAHMAQARYGRASVFGRLGRPDDALKEYAIAIRENPEFVPARVNRGALLAGRGQEDEALADYEAALAIDPLHVEAHLNRGVVRHRRRDYAGALADFDAALAGKPEHAIAWYWRGRAAFDSGQIADAIANFTSALRFDASMTDARIRRGMALEAGGRFGEALADLDAAVKMAPALAAAHGRRGCFH
ncbi:MAG: tetratricopeptide repeat protein, partial [Planctomycetota bacterium]